MGSNFPSHILCQAHGRAKKSFSLSLLRDDVSENTPEEIWAWLCPCHRRLLSLPFTRDGSDVTMTWLSCLQNGTNAHSWEKKHPAHGELILENRSGLMALQPVGKEVGLQWDWTRRRSFNCEHSEVCALHSRRVGKLQVWDSEELEFELKCTTRETESRWVIF